ncbi:hypothetical protein CR513_30443, partial [Mucuna pruriens]
MPYYSYVKELMKHFEKITFQHIPHEENQMVDTLATVFSMFEIGQEGEVPILKIRYREYPHGIMENNKRTLRKLAMSFFLNGDVLYKRNSDITFLLCVDAREEIHEGVFETHANGYAMAKKILKAGYYWAKMEADCCDHVRKCHKCQIYIDNNCVPLAPLNTLTKP